MARREPMVVMEQVEKAVRRVNRERAEKVVQAEPMAVAVLRALVVRRV